MTDQQRDYWRYAVEHAPYALLRRIDRDLLATWAVAADTHHRAAKALADGALLSAEGGARPELLIMNRQALVMVRAAIELGFTPTARSRIGIAYGKAPDENGKGETDPAQEFFGT